MRSHDTTNLGRNHRNVHNKIHLRFDVFSAGSPSASLDSDYRLRRVGVVHSYSFELLNCKSQG